MRNRLIRFINTTALTVFCGLLVGSLLAGWAQGNAERLMSIFFLAAWNTALLAIAALCAYVFSPGRLAHGALIGMVAALTQLATFAIIGYSDYWQNVDAVQQYGQLIIYRLEEYRTEHGHYPDVINPATVSPTPLDLPENALVYYRADDRYLLTFLQSDALGEFWIYDSAAREWKLIRKAPGETVWALAR
jgi:hypothetical protein